ncbi:MAG: MGMT family protein, partial [Bacilli bacterium]|nr:MGMT family protein [Bacilli bacterium]
TCPIFYPTHRVINADKTPGGYAGEVKKKVQLLKLEVMNVRNR